MEKRYIAVYNLTAFNGIGIIDIEHGIDDYCICEYFAGDLKRKSRNKIYTDIKDGRNYIRKLGNRFYLDEFIRI